MSGAYLRECATLGNTDELKRILQDKSNPCSQDKYGLTALHYAVWNGHVECVKYLVCNSWGVDKHGVKGHALNMVSCKGYTALHLAAQDAPNWVAKEITELLLVAGVDADIKDKHGMTAIAYARQEENNEVLAGFETYNELMTALREREEAAKLYEASLLNDTIAEATDSEEVKQLQQQNAAAAAAAAPISKLPLEKYFDEVKESYSFGIAVRELRDAGFEAIHQNLRFPAPSFITRRERYAALPAGLHIQEKFIKPMVTFGEKLPTISSYRCMQFALHEGTIARDRREKLLRVADPTWIPVDRDKILEDQVCQHRLVVSIFYLMMLFVFVFVQKPKSRHGRRR